MDKLWAYKNILLDQFTALLDWTNTRANEHDKQMKLTIQKLNAKEQEHMNIKKELARTITEFVNAKITHANEQIILNKRINDLQKLSAEATNNAIMISLPFMPSHIHSVKLFDIDEFHGDRLKFRGWIISLKNKLADNGD